MEIMREKKGLEDRWMNIRRHKGRRGITDRLRKFSTD